MLIFKQESDWKSSAHAAFRDSDSRAPADKIIAVARAY